MNISDGAALEDHDHEMTEVLEEEPQAMDISDVVPLEQHDHEMTEVLEEPEPQAMDISDGAPLEQHDHEMTEVLEEEPQAMDISDGAPLEQRQEIIISFPTFWNSSSTSTSPLLLIESVFQHFQVLHRRRTLLKLSDLLAYELFDVDLSVLVDRVSFPNFQVLRCWRK